jgi:hypothetical protein
MAQEGIMAAWKHHLGGVYQEPDESGTLEEQLVKIAITAAQRIGIRYTERSERCGYGAGVDLDRLPGPAPPPDESLAQTRPRFDEIRRCFEMIENPNHKLGFVDCEQRLRQQKKPRYTETELDQLTEVAGRQALEGYGITPQNTRNVHAKRGRARLHELLLANGFEPDELP